MVSTIDKIVAKMRTARHNVRYKELEMVCDFYFERQDSAGARRKASSHVVYKTPWAGDPRVNIQESKNGKAKAF